jgi:hypothetical protein
MLKILNKLNDIQKCPLYKLLVIRGIEIKKWHFENMGLSMVILWCFGSWPHQIYNYIFDSVYIFVCENYVLSIQSRHIKL